MNRGAILFARSTSPVRAHGTYRRAEGATLKTYPRESRDCDLACMGGVNFFARGGNARDSAPARAFSPARRRGGRMGEEELTPSGVARRGRSRSRGVPHLRGADRDCGTPPQRGPQRILAPILREEGPQRSRPRNPCLWASSGSGGYQRPPLAGGRRVFGKSPMRRRLIRLT
jgi:hypothetical protein